MNSTVRLFVVSRVAAILFWCACLHLHGATAPQSISLEPGWNSIWLTVNPVTTRTNGVTVNKTVEEVFNNPFITIVATPSKTVGATRTIELDTPGVFLEQDQWQIWRRGNENSGLDSLAIIRGHRPYLVYLDSDQTANSITLDIVGEAAFSAPRWTPNQYNLVGFGIEGTPTFSQVFAGTNGRLPVNRILRLEPSGNWIPVASTAPVRSGEAYWIYADGKVDFMAPVAASFPGTDRLDFGSGSRFASVSDPGGGVDDLEISLEELVLTNLTDGSLIAGLRQMDTTGTPDTAELRFVEVDPKPDAIGYNVVREISSPGNTLAASTTDHVTLGVSRNFIGQNPEKEELFQLVLGPVWYWLPMAATDPSIDLEGESANGSATAFTGLWQGTILIDQVTTLEQARTRPTTTTMPLKILVHIDSSGQARLLQQATLMQTVTADDSGGEPVIVISPEKLSQFEGVERKGYRLVGQRIETIDFDLPRSYDPGIYPPPNPDGTGLLAFVSGATGTSLDDITATEIETYVNGQDSRPVDLLEVYHTSWSLEGGIGPGQSLTTGSTPLTLDPFHRSNPFRHAFHNEHVAGYVISRSFEIVSSRFDARGRIIGVYRESISGLAKTAISTSGSIELVRLSEAGSLQ